MEGMYSHQQKTISSAFKNAQRFSPETTLGKYALHQIWWELIENLCSLIVSVLKNKFTCFNGNNWVGWWLFWCSNICIHVYSNLENNYYLIWDKNKYSYCLPYDIPEQLWKLLPSWRKYYTNFNWCIKKITHSALNWAIFEDRNLVRCKHYTCA